MVSILFAKTDNRLSNMSHYRTLGLPRSASPEKIKNAYRTAAMEHHPDRGGSAAIFLRIQCAYEVLGDAGKRRTYDEAENKRPVESLRNSMENLVAEFFSRCKTL